MEDSRLNTKKQNLEANPEANTSKCSPNFVYKTLLVTIFLLLIPLFPSQAPDFINQTLLNRSWELLHLIFVGIAVSYGLFSRRNEETDKETNPNPSKFDNAQSYVSRFLQVSSVFDDEAENLSGSDQESSSSSSSSSSSKVVQTWNNQYYRNEPVVVVAKENSLIDEQRGVTSNFVEKSLLLPVRSLKSRVLDVDTQENGEISVDSGSLSRSSSNLGSKRYLSKSKSGEPGPGGVDHANLGERLNETVVLPSPIPWKSRLGRMEVMENVDSPLLPPSMEEPEFRTNFRRSSRTNSENSSPKLSPSPSLSSPKKLSPSPSLSMESQAKSSEDLVRKKSFYRSFVPPPPPPPPPMVRRSSSIKPGPILNSDEEALEKDFRRSLTSGRMEFSSTGERPPKAYADNFELGKSVRTTKKASDSLNEVWMDKKVDVKPKENYVSGRKLMGFDQAEGIKPKSIGFAPKQTFTRYENDELGEKVLVETEDSDSESDDEVITKNTSIFGIGRVSEGCVNKGSDGVRDVDKKADEFIAKFREQIRLQRIDDIKKSTAHISRPSLR